MMLRTLGSLVSVVVFSLVACGGGGDLSALCAKAQECAEKAGTEFSKTECENEAKEESEKADTAGCGDEYSDYASCANGVDIECGDNLGNKLLAECGAEAKAYQKCAE